MLRKRPDLVTLKEQKVESILNLCRQKVIKEGWHKLSMRGVQRLLGQHNLSASFYFPTKTHLGFALAENEFRIITSLLRAIKQETKEVEPVTKQAILENSTLILLKHFQGYQNLFDLLLDLDLIEEYNQANLKFPSNLKPLSPLKNIFKQELFELFYDISGQGSLADPYKMLSDWFYLYFGLLRAGAYRDFEFTITQVKENIARLCAIKPP
jgi:AcrR family transcriptional regulator